MAPPDYQTELHVMPGARSVRRRHPRVSWTDVNGEHAIEITGLMLVGSAPNADVPVADATVSRLHAELDPKKDGLWIRDLGSRNGTHVNGMRISVACAPDRAKIQLGRAVLTLEPAGDEAEVELWPASHFGPLVGQSVVMRELFATLGKVAASDATVLVLGETGTGKERVAQAIHEASARQNGPLVIVDCAALPEQLLQAELFGHAKGAFTGAAQARAGAIEAADGGTVFLDEIGELPLAMQPALLRVLESRTVRRLGESAHRKVDVRFVSATHRDLRSMVTAGAFREDLYFRIAVLPVLVPPLRERMDDIPLLVDHFLPNLPPDDRHEILTEALDRPWLGNVRELRNYVDRAAAFGARRAAAMSDPPPSRSAGPAPIPPTPRPGADDSTGIERAFERPYREFRDEAERIYVERLLQRHGGNVSGAAQAAGLDRTYIHRLIKKHRG